MFFYLLLLMQSIQRMNLAGYEDTGAISFVIVCSIICIYLTTQIFVENIGSRRAIRIEALLQNGAMGIVGGINFSEVIYITPNNLCINSVHNINVLYWKY